MMDLDSMSFAVAQWSSYHGSGVVCYYLCPLLISRPSIGTKKKSLILQKTKAKLAANLLGIKGLVPCM